MSWELSLKTKLLVRSSAKNTLEVLARHESAIHLAERRANSFQALETKAQPLDWGKQLFCFMHNPLFQYLHYRVCFWTHTIKCQLKQVQWRATKTAMGWNTSPVIVQPGESLGHQVSNFQYLNYKNDEARLFTKVHGGRATSTVIWEAVNMY